MIWRIIARMPRRIRFLYRWSGGQLGRVGSIPEARLRAWEYDVSSDDGSWTATDNGVTDTVRLWKTARPDLGPPELWVGDTELIVEN